MTIDLRSGNLIMESVAVGPGTWRFKRRRGGNGRRLLRALVVGCGGWLVALAGEAPGLGDETATGPRLERAIAGHVRQSDIDAGRWTAEQLREAGRRLFVANFTIHDGVGRPRSTGNPTPKRRSAANQAGFLRTAGPDANSCAACHNAPDIGGAGDFSVNVFVGLGELDPPVYSIESMFSAERGTPDLHGAGLVELLAREITRTLHGIRAEAVSAARRTGAPIRRELVAKGIHFGELTAQPEGTVTLDRVDGIDHDLVVRPFGQKGNIVSLREFSINAANLHHGMQARERFGFDRTRTRDFDEDGIEDELTEGDITALALFQAALSVPGQVLPRDPVESAAIQRGETLFSNAGCAACHIPELPLESPLFREPGPHNIAGTLSVRDDGTAFALDLTKDVPRPRASRREDGRIVVRVFSDFKRHAIADRERPFFGNETFVQREIPTHVFLTKRLWATGNTAPYGHRGDLTTIREAIAQHGGEAAESRRKFEALDEIDRRAVVAFLRSLQTLPEGSPLVLVVDPPIELPYAATPDTP